MPLPLAIIGLDSVQRDWLQVAADLRDAGEIELVAAGHRTVAAARDIADALKSPAHPVIPAYDDLRLLLKETAPRIILLDRPANAPLDFLLTCVKQGIGLFSLGPPVESFAEAQGLSGALEARTHLLYIWPRFADAPGLAHCAQADEYIRPVRFIAGRWLGMNHALAKVRGDATDTGGHSLTVRSLCPLAWDALSTLIRLIDLPTSVFAGIRGNAGADASFADLSGAASVTLRFPEDAIASLVICDQAPLSATGPASWDSRELLIWGAGGTLRLGTHSYEFRNTDGTLVDEGPPGAAAAPPSAAVSREQAQHALREFFRHYQLPPSPHRGWAHRLEEVAATLEALVVSHRTGQPEFPGRFRHLRR